MGDEKSRAAGAPTSAEHPEKILSRAALDAARRKRAEQPREPDLQDQVFEAHNVHDEDEVAWDDPRLPELVRAVAREVAPAASVATPTTGTGSIGDPVRMYLASIGRQRNLTRDGEVATALRLEAGRRGWHRIALGTPLLFPFLEPLLQARSSRWRRRRTRDGRAVDEVVKAYAAVIREVPGALDVLRAAVAAAVTATAGRPDSVLDDVMRVLHGARPRASDPFEALRAVQADHPVLTAWDALTTVLDRATDLAENVEIDGHDAEDGARAARELRIGMRLARTARSLERYEAQLRDIEVRIRSLADARGIPPSRLATAIRSVLVGPDRLARPWREATGMDDDAWQELATAYREQVQARRAIEEARTCALRALEAPLREVLGVDDSDPAMFAPLFDPLAWLDTARIAEAWRQQREEATQALVQANIPLLVAIARQHERQGLEFSDLFWTGHIGLVRAVETYDYRRGYLFSSYAKRAIRDALEGVLARRNVTLCVPDSRVREVDTLVRTQRSLQEQLGRPATRGEVASASGLPVPVVQRWADNVLRPIVLSQTSKNITCSTLTGHTGPVSGTQRLLRGRVLSWSDDTTLRIWDDSAWDDEVDVRTCVGHADRVGGALRLGKWGIVSWSDDGTLSIWDQAGGENPSWTGHLGAVRGTATLPDGRWLSWSDDATLRVWSRDGRTSRVLDGHHGPVRGVLVLGEGVLLSWDEAGEVWVWNADGSPRTTLVGHTGAVTGALALPGGVLTWSSDHTLRVWEADGSPVATLTGHTNRVRGATRLQDGRLLSWSEDGTLRLWSVDGTAGERMVFHDGDEQEVLPEDDDEEAAGQVTTAVAGARELPDGRIVAWDDVGNLGLWDGHGRRLLTVTVLQRGQQVVDVTPLANGGWVAWSSDGRLTLVHGMNSLCVAAPPTHRGRVRGVSRMDGGRWLGWTLGGMVRLLDDATGLPLEVIDAAEAVKDAPEVYRAWRTAVAATSVLATGIAEGTNEGINVHLGRSAFHTEVAWFAAGAWSVDQLHPDGTLVARSGRDVAVLELYSGNRRVSVDEAEDLAARPDA